MAVALMAAPADMAAQARRPSSSQTTQKSVQKSTPSSSTQQKSAPKKATPSTQKGTPSSTTQQKTSTPQRSTSGAVQRSSSSTSASPQKTTPSSSAQKATPQRSTGTMVRQGTTTGSGKSSSATTPTRSRPVTTLSQDPSGSGKSSTSPQKSSTASGVVRSTPSTGSSQPKAQPQTGSAAVRSSANVTRRGLSGTVQQPQDRQPQATLPSGPSRDRGGNYRYGDGGFRVDDRADVHRIPPRERGFMPYDRPGHYWADQPHYYGYRVRTLPPNFRRVTYWGLDYYLYDGIYYRPFNGVYVVCRPPFGVIVDRIIDRAVLNAVTFSYYSNVYRTYGVVNDNMRTIAEQNRVIAENNARIAAQQSYAMNSSRALSAYELADRLGLVQSYAYAGSEYYYQDGVFYILSDGRYSVIIPPAGALVTSLPDDYDTIVLNGIEYYQVDNTVFRTTLVDGIPYLEVLGQLFSTSSASYRYSSLW